MKKILSIIAFSIIIILSGCSNYDYDQEKLNVVTTTTMIADLVNQVGGDKVKVTPLMGIGVDPHLYTPKAKDTTALLRSDFIVYNGLHLEGKMVDVLGKLSKDKPVLELGNNVILKGHTIKDDNNNYDPHLWFDVRNWIISTNSVLEKLIELDEDNKDYYINRSELYIDKLNDLHDWILNEIETNLLEDERILITAHDAFSYFGKAYGFKVSSIQGISTVTEASIKDINNLIDLIVETQTKSIFIESSVSNYTILQVINGVKAKGFLVSLGEPLFSDSLGDGIYSEYIEAFKYNVTTIIKGLKGE